MICFYNLLSKFKKSIIIDWKVTVFAFFGITKMWNNRNNHAHKRLLYQFSRHLICYLIGFSKYKHKLTIFSMRSSLLTIDQKRDRADTTDQILLTLTWDNWTLLCCWKSEKTTAFCLTLAPSHASITVKSINLISECFLSF